MKMAPSCDGVQELVSWVANGTAESGEQQVVYRHIVRCGECRRELARMLALRADVCRSMCAPQGLPPGDWSRLEATLPPPAEDRSRHLTRKLAVAMDLLGLPAVLSGTLLAALNLSGYRPVIQVSLPIIADVDLGL